MEISKIHLKEGAEKRILSGHLWIYNNEIEEKLSSYEPGGLVDVFRYDAKFIGKGYINPHSLISIRLLTHDQDEEIDVPFFMKRIERAHRLRRIIYPDFDSYRVVFSEGDLLPGLIVDKYENSIVLQIHTLGMEKLKEKVIEAIDEYFKPSVIVLRNDSSVREIEGMAREKKIAKGSLSNPVVFKENEYLFYADILNGQKTGFFFDQRENRAFAARISRGKRVLDLYCNTGSWSIYSAGGGAISCWGVDTSETAIDLARKNAKLNRVEDICTFFCEDAKSFLARCIDKGETYDIVYVDPPAFIKKRKDLPAAKRAYFDLNYMAFCVVSKEGIIGTSSCSFHLMEESFIDILKNVSTRSNRRITILRKAYQAPDHPVNPSIPETFYLKTFFLKMD